MVKIKKVSDKMITINKNIQSEILMTTMEEIVPEDSLFRKIDKYIDFTFIYDKVKDLYCENNGRPSTDPVVLFKIVFIQALDGIKSIRQTCKKIKVDAEYRWFLGIPFGIDTPHFSTFSKNYERRFKDSNIFEEIFVEIVNQAIKYNLVDGTTFYTDSTHKRANANKNKYDDEIIKVVKERRKWLEEEINEERIKQGRKPFEYKDEIEEKHIKVSKTDKESGYYHRDNKEKGFMYLDHRTVDDKCNIIVDAYVTKGNVHDSVPFINRAEYIKYKFGFDIVRRHIHEEWNELFRENRLSKEGKELYQKRKEHVERSFADSKQNHGYRYAMYKGVKKNQHYTWLICATQNMKNIAIKNDNVGKKPLTLSSYIHNFIKILKNIIKILFIRKPLEKI